jgi:hypothetical protein
MSYELLAISYFPVIASLFREAICLQFVILRAPKDLTSKNSREK